MWWGSASMNLCTNTPFMIRSKESILFPRRTPNWRCLWMVAGLRASSFPSESAVSGDDLIKYLHGDSKKSICRVCEKKVRGTMWLETYIYTWRRPRHCLQSIVKCADEHSLLPAGNCAGLLQFVSVMYPLQSTDCRRPRLFHSHSWTQAVFSRMERSQMRRAFSHDLWHTVSPWIQGKTWKGNKVTMRITDTMDLTLNTKYSPLTLNTNPIPREAHL